MEIIFGLTPLECLEHAARLMYMVQLLFTTESWLSQNMVGEVTPMAVQVTQMAGIFLLCIKGLFFVTQMKAPGAKPIAWLSAGVSWSACTVLNLMNEEKAKKPDWYINIVVTAFFGIGFLASAFLSGKLKSEAGLAVQRKAPIIFGLTLLECLEHAARLMYMVQLLFTAESWLSQNMVGEVTPMAVYMTQLAGIFLFGITCLFLVIQLKAPDAKPFAWLSQGVGWSACLVLNLMNEEKAKKPDWYISVVVCAFFGIGFLASALFSGKLKSEAGHGKGE